MLFLKILAQVKKNLAVTITDVFSNFMSGPFQMK